MCPIGTFTNIDFKIFKIILDNNKGFSTCDNIFYKIFLNHNFHNIRTLGHARDMVRESPKVNVWCRPIHSCFIGPFFQIVFH